MGREVVEDHALAAVRAAEPPLGKAGAICLDAWNTLDTARERLSVQIGMFGSAITSGPIPWPAVRDWCEWLGLGRDETAVVAFVLRRLDADRDKREAKRLQALAQKK